MVHEIYIIDDDIRTKNILEEMFKNDEEYTFKSVQTEQINIALKNIPSLIIINEDTIKRDTVELCQNIRQNEDNNITPVIVISSNNDREHRIKVLENSVEYFIKKPVDDCYLYHTIKNLTRLIYVNRRISPLTGLPGNVQIHAELRKRLLNKEEFAIVYLDLDNFKSYNDVYGFLKGDEIIKFTARVIQNNIHNLENKDSFIGHIGGDDFVAIITPTDYDKICRDIIFEFDKKVLEYFRQEDIKNGYVEVANRRGIIEQFPLTSVSIGVVEVSQGRFKNILEIGEIGAQVKHLAKTITGSSYVVNKRKKVV